MSSSPPDSRVIWDLSRISDRTLTRIEFPDLIRFRDHWYCGFREGDIHNNHPSGRARIIRSRDGLQWDTVHLIDWDCGDVREPKFSITAEGLLMMNTSVYFVSRKPRFAPTNGGDATYTPPEARRANDQPGRYFQLDWNEYPLNLPPDDREHNVGQQSMTWLSRDGVNWSGAHACAAAANGWLWSTAWHQGMGYSVSYWGKDMSGVVYRTRDGRQWRKLAEGIFPDNHAGEVALAFDDNHDAVALLRGNNKTKLFVGRAEAPHYQQWTWSQPQVDWHGDGALRPVADVFGVGMGGPKLLRLRDGRFVAAGRVLGPDCDDGRATLFMLDPDRCVLTRFAACDGTSYPGLAEHDDELWVTYIGSACHDDQWEVRLARIKMPMD